MTATQGNLAGLSRFIFRAPRWYASIAFALLIAAATGIAVFEAEFPLDDAWQGVFYLGLPTVTAALGTPLVDGFFGGKLTHNRSSLLALVCELIVIAIVVIAALLAFVTPLGQEFVLNALLFALAAIFGLRLLVVMAVSRQSLPVASAAASLQTAAAAVLLFVYTGTMRYMEIGGPISRAFLYRPDNAPARLSGLDYMTPKMFGVLAVLSGLCIFAVWLFLVLVDRPWRSTLGVSSLDFVRGFVGHIAEGTRELEDFFEDLGEDALVPVTVLSIRRPDGEEKARFVLPMIHPGPMGEIGGGNLPERVAADANGVAFPPHATAGHDFNLVTNREVDTILARANDAYESIEYDDTATKSQVVSEGEATLTGQAFGDEALIINTFAPGCADDVDYAVGLSVRSEAKNGGLQDVLLVDAHNCNDGLDGDDLGHVVPGSQRSFDMYEGARELGQRLTAADRHDLRCGVAWDETDWEPRDGIGPLGVRVAVFEVDGQRSAYVLIDGNNMEPGLRERIVDRIDGADAVEVMTTDTHVVNTVEAENQVGSAIDETRLISLIDELVGEAIDDLESVEAGMATEQAQVTVFGNDRTEMLASTANAVVSLGGALAALFVLAVLGISALVFFLTG